MDSSNTLNVLLTMPFSAAQVEKISAVSPRIAVTQREARTPEDIADVIAATDVLYTWNVFPSTAADAPRLRWVQLHQAGIDALTENPLYLNSDVAFTTGSGIHAIPMAEYTMAMVLAFAHHMPRMMEDKISGLWPSERWNRYLPKELYGSTIGIIGYGSIGRQIARVAAAFGMKVLAIKRDLRQPGETNTYTVADTGDPEGELPDRMYPPEALHSFLGECDFVVLTVPLTGTTKHLIDAAALKAMKMDAVLINVARGDVIDEAALIEALRNELLRGAALDVFSQEPLPADSPLWTLPNVIISPHIAGLTPQYYERAADLFAENLRRFIGGEPLMNQVDRGKGY
jgi:phosphoglycerate dehydrogenase-like enzyme